MVEETGQRVAVGAPAGVLVEARVLERHRRLVGHRPRDFELLGVPADRRPREQLDQADRLALGDEWQHHEHADPVAAQEHDLGRIGAIGSSASTMTVTPRSRTRIVSGKPATSK